MPRWRLAQRPAELTRRADGKVEGDEEGVNAGDAEAPGHEALGGCEDGVELVFAGAERAGRTLARDEAAQAVGDVAGVAGGARVRRAGVGDPRAEVEGEREQGGDEEERCHRKQHAAQDVVPARRAFRIGGGARHRRIHDRFERSAQGSAPGDCNY